MKNDPDYDWLLGHLPRQETLPSRSKLAEKVCDLIQDRIDSGALPHTLGIFGGWGSGKTTFLAMLAKRLQAFPDQRVIYFNSWKYAGFMEIVPSLIYKILQYGVAGTEANRNQAAMRVLLSLGKEYSDRFGKWAEERVGVNPVGLFKDVYRLKEIVDEGKESVRPELLKAYYNQVDRAQDVLAEVLGTVKEGEAPEHPVIVLIDELDRCDPDEAFNVIKQMRVLFAMRRVPVAFVVCANPEPIGLAIKHRYGLESDSGDYEARRILEKFVDAYEDLAEPAPLRNLARQLWAEAPKGVLPWVLAVDDANGDAHYGQDTIRNAVGFDVINTTIPHYANLRLLHKSYRYVVDRARSNRHLLWTIWHLEIVSQVDPRFRRELRLLSEHISHIVSEAYRGMGGIRYEVRGEEGARQLVFQSDKGLTLFAIFRSLFWEAATRRHDFLSHIDDPQSRDRQRLLQELLVDYRRMDFMALLSLVPFQAPGHKTLAGARAGGELPALGTEFEGSLGRQFGWLLANY